jgi:hypothetical protein
MRFKSMLPLALICPFVCAGAPTIAIAQTASGAGASASLHGVATLRGPALDQMIASVRPTDEEDRYRQVPWRTNIVAALKEAQEQKKPLFIWAMDGNPLCWT